MGFRCMWLAEFKAGLVRNGKIQTVSARGLMHVSYAGFVEFVWTIPFTAGYLPPKFECFF